MRLQSVTGISLGMAGQLRVASELILRGHKPALSLVDTGVDLLTETGIRIQVKTARYSKVYHSYPFNFRRWDRSGPHGLEGVDFVICWGISSDDFWVFPVDAVNKYTTVRISMGGRTKRVSREQYHNAWHLLDGGGDAKWTR